MIKSIKNWFPIKDIKDGIIETKVGKYCKVLEVTPINFELKSVKEQENILYKYKSFLNNCDFDIQILIQSKKSNLDNHIKNLEKKMLKEKSEKVKHFIEEYINMVKNETLKSAITKKFYIVFFSTVKSVSLGQISFELNEKTIQIRNSLEKCGNIVKEINNKEIIYNLYEYMNLKTSKIQPLNMEVK